MRKLYLLIFVIALSFLAIAEEKKPAVLNFGYEDGNAYPWVLPDGTGLDIELIKIVEKKLGVKINLQKFPWKRCLDSLKSNELDGIFAASYKEDRLLMGVYPTGKDGKDDPEKRIHFSEYSIYKLKGDPLDWDGKEFKNLTGKIGAQSGFSIVDSLKKMKIDVDDGTKEVEANFKKLIAKRVQGVAIQTARGDFVLNKYPEFSKNIEKIETQFEKKAYYLMLSFNMLKNYPEFSKRIWDEVAIVRESKEFKEKVEEFYNNTKD